MNFYYDNFCNSLIVSNIFKNTVQKQYLIYIFLLFHFQELHMDFEILE